MSLNLKLQSSAAKNQARAVELEIKKLEARERGELLGIVQVGFFSSCTVYARGLAGLTLSLFSLIYPNNISNPIATLLIATSSSHVWHTKPILSTLLWDKPMAYPSHSMVSSQKFSSGYVKCVSFPNLQR
jgi:hypothetical protein